MKRRQASLYEFERPEKALQACKQDESETLQDTVSRIQQRAEKAIDSQEVA